MAFDARVLNGIGIFVAVVETGTFVRAAASLGLTPSGVSRAVGRLESRLGIRLFERNARSMILTEAGRRFHAEVSPLLAAMAEAAGTAAGSAAVVGGRLRINCDPWFASLVLAPRLQSFLDAHPALLLDLVIRHELGDLVAEGFDAAIRFGEPTSSNLIVRKLLDTRILTCAAPSYLERHGWPGHPQDLAGPAHTCLLFRDPATGQPFAWEFHRGGEILTVDVHGRLLLNDGATAVAACLAGLGVAQPMALGLGGALETGLLVDLFPEWSDERFPLHVYYPSRHLNPAKLRAFIDFIVEDVAVLRGDTTGTAPSHLRSKFRNGERDMATSKTLTAGEKVRWDTPQGETHGKVIKKVTGTAKAGGHTAKANKDAPQFRVKSDKSGKEAIHKADELKKG